MRLICARVEPIIDPLLPQEQAGFRCGKSTVDPVTLLTQDAENSCSAKKKAGAVFVDLTGAYNTMSSPANYCDCYLTGTCSAWPWSWLAIEASPYHRQRQTEQVTTPQERRPTEIRPGNPSLQHLHLWPAKRRLKKVCTRLRLSWQAVEGVLNKDMSTVGEYIQTWKLKLGTTKTVSTVFHLHNKEAKRELKTNHNNETCPSAPNPNTS